MGPGKEDIFEVGSEGLSVADVAANLALSPEQVIADLFMIGIMANVNQVRYTSCGQLHKQRTPADRQCRLTPSRAQSEHGCQPQLRQVCRRGLLDSPEHVCACMPC